MPYITPQQRAAGSTAWVSDDPHDGGPCGCDWSVPTSAASLQHRVIAGPDQSRYGTATSDPLGRDAPGWRIGKHGLPVRVKDTA